MIIQVRIRILMIFEYDHKIQMGGKNPQTLNLEHLSLLTKYIFLSKVYF